jgi:hypothetical protein
MTNRALVIVGPDGVVRWSHLADSPGDLPGVGLIFDGLAAAEPSAEQRRHALGAVGEDRLEVAAHDRAVGQRAQRSEAQVVAHGVAHAGAPVVERRELVGVVPEP